MNTPISISLVTGFLGSGKTTLIRRLLSDPLLRGSLVIVNDLAPIGLDQILLQDGDNTPILLANGCICCTVNRDLGFTLLELLNRVRSGEIPPVRHVMIETTGMADPIPILRILAGNATLAGTYALDRIVTLIDARHGRTQLDRYPEARLQVAVADFVLLSQGSAAAEIEGNALPKAIANLNPAAKLVIDANRFPASQLLAQTRVSRRPDPRIGTDACAPAAPADGHRHDVTVACLTARQPLDWSRLVEWIEGLSHAHREDLLRIKGTVTITGQAAPLFINGVQEIFYPPIVLPNWFDPTGGSQLVVIGRAIDPRALEASFRAAVEN
jgi:G3E family GTPase